MAREIRPGDKVEHQSRMCRVIEVYPDKTRLKIHRVSGVQSGVKRIDVEAIDGHEPRAENEVIVQEEA